MPILSVRDIHKQFEDSVGVLHGVSIDVEKGEIACLLGPSGCGKTTLLRVIAGLEAPDRGQVVFDGRDILPVPAHRRGFGLMFQDYALFPHKDVAANVAFGLRMQGLPREQVERRVGETLDLVNLLHLAHRDIHQLSGGEQQRVALARSLAPQPKLLMLDEPIGALDRTLRDRLLEELRNTLKRVGVTVLYVTHDQSEAFAISDRVILMYAGRVMQVGAPEAVYRQPINAWAARFLGMRNLLTGEWTAPGLVSTAIGELQVEGCAQGRTIVLIRPDAAAVGRTEAGTVIRGTLTSRSFRGALVHVVVDCSPGRALSFDLPAGAGMPAPGQSITLTIRPEGIVCLRE
jgi:ABC-type Fe3+/spermidine/putrescine transport system ATPase subunit